MTDQRSYEDGRANRPADSGTDQHAYNRGQQDREAGMRHDSSSVTKNAPAQKIDWSTFWGPKVEVPGVAYTLILVAPMIWMIYPALGVTLYVVAVGCFLLFKALNVPMHWGFLIGLIICVMSFFPGMILETKATQVTVYRWFRALVRIGAPLIFVLVGVTGDDPSNFQFFIKKIEPTAMVGGFFIGVIAYLIYQRLDLIYFPAKAKIKKMQEQLKKGERPQRSMAKRLFYGFCWFVPVMAILAIIVAVAARTFLGHFEGQDFMKQYGPIIGPINAVIWYLLCLFGLLPGTGKYMFSKAHEENLQQIQT